MRHKRAVVGVATTAGALMTAVVVGGGLVYAGQLLPATGRDRTLDITATLTHHGTVILPADRRACAERFGLLLADGFLQFGGLVRGTCDGLGTVERDVLAILEGDPSIGSEQPARFDEYVVLGTPDALGIDFADITFRTELGLAQAWFVAGERPDWAIIVHGRSGQRAEALRLLPSVVQAGFPSLVISYRNDFSGGPPSEDGTSRFGQAEWPDLRDAVTHALAHGARKVVLIGFSQGGSLISYFLREVGDADVAGVILDSPLLSLDTTLVQQARLRDIPGPLIPPILFGTGIVARLQSGFNVGDVSHVATLAGSEAPLLLMHGAKDDFVPVKPSDDLALLRSGSLVYERFERAGHVEPYNFDSARYNRVITDFLRSL